MKGQRTCPTPPPIPSQTWLLEGLRKNRSHCPCPGIQQEPRPSQQTQSREWRSQALVPMSVQCRKATPGFKGPVIGDNFFKSALKTSDTGIT